ncbi:MAG: indole-3-glycerol phosphate synthase TrpC [Litorimonas sp.]
MPDNQPHNLMDTPDVLKKIAAYKATEVAALKARTTIEALRAQAAKLPAARGFSKAIQAASTHKPALICEVKKASPSKGIIREDFDPVAIAKAYDAGGAAAMSVLTDGPGFQGSGAIFTAIRAETNLPLLRKDFMLDPIQIAQSAAMGADCVLIIMAMIDDVTATVLMDEAQALGMDALVETHDASELTRAINLGANLIGINNRDLRTFHTTLDTFTALAPKAPENAVLIAESGIFTKADIERLTSEGAQGFLIGESLMRQDDVEAAVRGLLA